jgi:hypothetical protein
MVVLNYKKALKFIALLDADSTDNLMQTTLQVKLFTNQVHLNQIITTIQVYSNKIKGNQVLSASAGLDTAKHQINYKHHNLNVVLVI